MESCQGHNNALTVQFSSSRETNDSWI